MAVVNRSHKPVQQPTVHHRVARLLHRVELFVLRRPHCQQIPVHHSADLKIDGAVRILQVHLDCEHHQPKQVATGLVAARLVALGHVNREHHGRVCGPPEHNPSQVAELPPAREGDAVEEPEDERQERRRVRKELVGILEQEVVELQPLVRRKPLVYIRAGFCLDCVAQVFVQEAEPLRIARARARARKWLSG